MTRLPRNYLTIPVIALTVAAAVLLGGGAAAAPSPVNLGTADAFAVLGGSTVTNTGPSFITGSLGVSPGSAITGFPPGIVSPPEAIHPTDVLADEAQDDVTTAYNVAAALPCTATLTGQNLGGMTLTPGVYCFSSSAQLTGPLTLNGLGNAEADFVFQIGSTLTTASASSMLLIGQAQPCRVFFQVGSSATLGTGSQFVGTILALTSITATTGATIQGRLLARNGAVTLDTNTITRPSCLPAATTSSTTAGGGTNSTVATGATSSTVASGAATTPTTKATPAAVTTRATVPTVTAATTPGRNQVATTTTRAPARSAPPRLATTGGQFAVLVAAALLALVAGATILSAPRLRAAGPGSTD